MSQNSFLTYRDYLFKRYGNAAYRVGIDGGFSCPNRKEGRESAGCTFCGSFGARSAYLGDQENEIRDQVSRSLAFIKRRYSPEVLLLYFQAYSGTWAPVEKLKSLYDYALGLEKFSELIVSTRPDCLDEEKCDLLASYKKEDFDVWVELGLQSAHNRTLNRLNRGHSVEEFEKAFRLLQSRGIKTAVHLIFGLPGESWQDMEESVRYVASLRPHGVKFHNLHIPTGTVMYEEYLRGELSFPSSDRHADYVARAIEYFHKDTVIMRLTTDTPGSRHSIPGYFLDKTIVYNKVREHLEKRKSYQGARYQEVS